MAMQSGFFGCGAHSGQGGAFRQISETRIAAFVVINALGAATERSGHMVTCHRHPDWGSTTQTSDLIARAAMAAGPAPRHHEQHDRDPGGHEPPDVARRSAAPR